MEFIDLREQQVRIRSDIEKRIKNVLDHGKYIMGPEVDELEERLAAYVGTKYAIGVASGTDALLVALMALEIGRGDEVITTGFSFVATAEAIAILGAKPVFVDIDPLTYNIDPTMIEASITPRTKAILPVSLYGQCAAYGAINAIAEKHGLPVIEDGAQSLGATCNGHKSCGLTTIGCTSFFPSKPLGGYGDGGACFTNDDGLAKIMRELRVHGQERRYHHSRIGINGRLDTIQAAILLEKLKLFPDEVSLRNEVGARYSDMLKEICSNVVVPYIEDGNTSVYAQYTIRVEDRDRVRAGLTEAGIPTAVHYPIPLNRQPAFAKEYVDLPVSDDVSNKVVSLPMHPYLKKDEQETIAYALSKMTT